MEEAKDEHQAPGHQEPQHEGHKPGHPGGILGQIRKHPLFFDAIFIAVVILIVAGIYIWLDMSGKIYVENAAISAPIISITPANYGIIEKFYVNEGDQVSAGQRLALVGDQVITAQTAGTVISIDDTPGALTGPGLTPVLQMIDP